MPTWKIAPSSSPVVEKEDPQGPPKPLLSVLHLWRVTPSQESLYNIIRPSKGQPPIIMRAVRMSERKVVMTIWAVSDGEAVTVSVYDPKAVETLELTFLSGWWAELGIPPLKSMTMPGLCGLAAYLVQGISLQKPQPDRKGRVDMSKASLQFNPGPPPPLFEFEPSYCDANAFGESKMGSAAKTKGGASGRVLWRGFRAFKQRAVLLACARNGPSEVIIRGWDSSMSWRMTNVVTFHEEDWKTWKEVIQPARPSIAACFVANDSELEEEAVGHAHPLSTQYGKGEQQREHHHRQQQERHGDDARIMNTTCNVSNISIIANEKNQNDKFCGGSARAVAIPKKARGTPPPPSSLDNPLNIAAAIASDRAKNDCLCEAIADRVEVRPEGRGGKIALKVLRRPVVGAFRANVGGKKAKGRSGEEGEDDDGDAELQADEEGDGEYGGQPGSAGAMMGGGGLENDDQKGQNNGKEDLKRRGFMSYKDMEDRVKNLDMTGLSSAEGLGGPRRPLEDPDGSSDEWLGDIPNLQKIKVLTRRRGADGKMRTMEEIVEQLAKARRKEEMIAAAKRQEAVRKWKNLGSLLCRLLRMSDYWYGFASDGILTSEERAMRRVSVLHQVVEMRGGGRTNMKSLVRAIAKRYPRSVWASFRQLMRLPKSQRMRRDMAVCAILLGDIDNQFFKYTTAKWPFSQMVDLASDVRLVKKPTLSVLYEEGETAPKMIGIELQQLPGRIQRNSATRTSVGGRCNTARATADSNKDRRNTCMAAGRWSVSTNLNEFNNHSITNMVGVADRDRSGSVMSKTSGERLSVVPQPQERQCRQGEKEEWTVGAYVIMRGSVDLYVLERGAAAKLPTAASQEDFATKACRGQPMQRSSPPSEWIAEDIAAEAVRGGKLTVGRGIRLHGRRQQRRQRRRERRAVTEPFEAALSGSGSVFRRARTRNLDPKWKACRLGAGALFGDRPMLVSPAASPQLLSKTQQSWGANNHPLGQAPTSTSPGPALETAITAEETELLEIGAESYRRYLADGVRERVADAVAVLKATGAMDGIPTPALARICRYATERTAGERVIDITNPPLLNPSASIVASANSGSSFGNQDDEDDFDENYNDHDDDNSKSTKSSKSSDDDSSSDHNCSNSRIMCRRGTFRGSVYFIADGQGEVVYDGHEKDVFQQGLEGERYDEGDGRRHGLGGGRGSSTESLLAAAAFAHTHSNTNRKKASRRRDGKADGRRNGTGVGDGVGNIRQNEHREGGAKVERGGNPKIQSVSHERQQRVPGISSPTPSATGLSISLSEEEREQSGWGDSGGSDGDKGRWSWPTVLRRGDFFGVDPPSPAKIVTGFEQGLVTLSPRSLAARYPRSCIDKADAATPLETDKVVAAFPAPAAPVASGEEAAGAPAVAPAASTVLAPSDKPGVKRDAALEACSRRLGLIEATDPASALVNAAESSVARSAVPIFPGLHMASLVAGPGGLRCLVVGLTALQKICPHVHHRLARKVSERYLGWISEARRRNEHDWQESLENESVQSLSKSFYNSFAKGTFSGSVSPKGSSVGYVASCETGDGGDGGGGNNANSFADDGYGGGDEATSQGVAIPVASSTHFADESSQTKSMFDLSRRYAGLERCSSARDVVPVRLGRSLVQAPQAASPSLVNQSPSRKRPVPPPTTVSGGDNACSVARRTSPRPTPVVRVVQPVWSWPIVSDLSSYDGRSTAEPSNGGGTDRQPVAEKDPIPSFLSSSFTIPGRTEPHGLISSSPGAHNNGSKSVHGSDFSGGCRRGRRCGSSRPPRQVPISLDRLGVERVDAVGTLEKRYSKRETYDHPVSPFRIPPSWAEIPPPSRTGFSPRPPTIPKCTTALVEGEGEGGQERELEVEKEKEEKGSPSSWRIGRPSEGQTTSGTSLVGLVEGREGEDHSETSNGETLVSRTETLPPVAVPPNVEGRDRTETVKAMTIRAVKKTLFQTISSGRRPSYGWGWKQLPGHKDWRRARKDDPGLAAVMPSPFLERNESQQQWGGIKLKSVPPPTS